MSTDQQPDPAEAYYQGRAEDLLRSLDRIVHLPAGPKTLGDCTASDLDWLADRDKRCAEREGRQAKAFGAVAQAKRHGTESDFDAALREIRCDLEIAPGVWCDRPAEVMVRSHTPHPMTLEDIQPPPEGRLVPLCHEHQDAEP